MDNRQIEDFEQVNDRLKEIIQLVGDDEISLDAALDLFEEAAKLGVQASTMLEDDIIARNTAEQQAPEEF